MCPPDRRAQPPEVVRERAGQIGIMHDQQVLVVGRHRVVGPVGAAG
jgi:hypothetical protein